MQDPVDVAILGGGPAGYAAAIRAAQRGALVAVIEERRVGGTCLNRGCIPAKAMARDAELLVALRSGAFAARAGGDVLLDVPRLLARRAEVVETLVSGVEGLLARHRVRLVAGQGRVAAPGAVAVSREDGSAEIVSARAILVATGSEPVVPPIPGADLPGVVTSDGLLALDRVPASMVVIGAGVIGTEFASIYAALGTRVAMVEMADFLMGVDVPLARRYRAILKRQGVAVSTGVQVTDIAPAGDAGLRVTYVEKDRTQTVDGEVVLLATGRRPRVSGLGLEAIGVARSGPAVAVNAHMETSVPGVYAAGDCVGGIMLAHVASYEGEVAVDNILGRPREADYAVVPNCVYTLPEIAGVGLTEEEAKRRGLAVKVTRFPFAANGRAQAFGETEGQVRMICAQESDGHGGRLLGVHILGPLASELIGEAALAIRLGAGAEDLARTMHQHPTLSEALMEAAMAQGDGAIHYDSR